MSGSSQRAPEASGRGHCRMPHKWLAPAPYRASTPRRSAEWSSKPGLNRACFSFHSSLPAGVAEPLRQPSARGRTLPGAARARGGSALTFAQPSKEGTPYLLCQEGSLPRSAPMSSIPVRSSWHPLPSLPPLLKRPARARQPPGSARGPPASPCQPMIAPLLATAAQSCLARAVPQPIQHWLLVQLPVLTRRPAKACAAAPAATRPPSACPSICWTKQCWPRRRRTATGSAPRT